MQVHDAIEARSFEAHAITVLDQVAAHKEACEDSATWASGVKHIAAAPNVARAANLPLRAAPRVTPLGLPSPIIHPPRQPLSLILLN